MNADWNYPTQIKVGAGCIHELPALCLSLGMRAPLLVTDPFVAGLPMTQVALKECLEAGLAIACFSDIKANPTGKNIKDGIVTFKTGNHDGVIAMGGGSGLDAGKAIALCAHQARPLWDFEDIGENFLRADENLIAPIIAIPTTAGTGSEVGRAALIVKEQEQRKVILFHPKMLPTQVILDPDLTLGLPANLTAATGMDALAHNLEAYCASGFHPMAEGIAIEGIRLVKKHLPIAVHDGSNVESRLQMLVASTMGATAFQRGLGAMHALAHPLGAVFDAHHGLLNAVLMPYVLIANRPVIEDKISRLALWLGLPSDFDSFLSWILELRQEIDIPNSLDAVINVTVEPVDIAMMAVNDPTAATNPINFSVDQYQLILTNAMQGKL